MRPASFVGKSRDYLGYHCPKSIVSAAKDGALQFTGSCMSTIDHTGLNFAFKLLLACQCCGLGTDVAMPSGYICSSPLPITFLVCYMQPKHDSAYDGYWPAAATLLCFSLQGVAFAHARAMHARHRCECLEHGIMEDIDPAAFSYRCHDVQ